MTGLRAAHATIESEVALLVRSIRHPRYLPPLIAVREGDGLVVVDGVQRMEALRRLGHEAVWTIVADDGE